MHAFPSLPLIARADAIPPAWGKIKKCVVCNARFHVGGPGSGSGYHSRNICSDDCKKIRDKRNLRKRERIYRARHRQKLKVKRAAKRAAERALLLALKKQLASREPSWFGLFTTEDIERIKVLQRNRCAGFACRRSLLKCEVNYDHIIPLDRGGTNDPRNIQLLCKRCNSRKGALDPIEYARRNGRLL